MQITVITVISGISGEIFWEQSERKVPPAYSRALPIHAQAAREWDPEYARSLNGCRDDESLGALSV